MATRPANIKIECDDCGQVARCTSVDVILEIQVGGQASRYIFPCAVCGELKYKPADSSVIGILRGAGVLQRPWILPVKMSDRHNGPPINEDDLIAFGLALEAQL